jgi:hypothetical protein
MYEILFDGVGFLPQTSSLSPHWGPRTTAINGETCIQIRQLADDILVATGGNRGINKGLKAGRLRHHYTMRFAPDTQHIHQNQATAFTTPIETTSIL